MKTNTQPTLFSRISSLKVVSGDFSDSFHASRSPYLKAILSATTSIAQSENTPVANPDREAALRYIRESKMLKK